MVGVPSDAALQLSAHRAEDMEDPLAGLKPEDEWLIEDALPSLVPNIFAGPSGAGKTTYLFQMLQTLKKGEDWHGHRTFPREYVYISGEHPKREVARTLRRLHIPCSQIPVIGSTEIPKGATLEKAIEMGEKLCPNAKLFIIEGCIRFVPGGKFTDPHIVLNWIVDLQRICEKRGISMILVFWEAKTKKGEEYTNPRQRAMGSVAFAGCTSTVVLVEPFNPEDKSDSTRRLIILPRNGPEEEFFLTYDEHGRLQPTNAPDAKRGEIFDYILQFDNDFVFTCDDLHTAFPDMTVRAINRVLRNLVEQREVVRMYRGHYKRSRAVSPPVGLPGVQDAVKSL